MSLPISRRTALSAQKFTKFPSDNSNNISNISEHPPKHTDDSTAKRALRKNFTWGGNRADAPQAKAANELTAKEGADLRHAIEQSQEDEAWRLAIELEEDEDWRRATELSQEDEDERHAFAEGQLMVEQKADKRSPAACQAFNSEKELLHAQMLEHNKAMPGLEADLNKKGYIIRDSNGAGNNCLFYSLVQCLSHHEKSVAEIESLAAQLRKHYDLLHPGNEGQSLFFDNDKADTANRGNATSIIDLINEYYNKVVHVEMFSPLFSHDEKYTPTLYHGTQVNDIKKVVIRLLDTPGHFKSIIEK